MDENFSMKKRKTYDVEKSSNIPLYLSAIALLISGTTAFFLYKEMNKSKTNIEETRKVKNQLLNIDSKLEDNTIQLSKLIHMLNSPIPSNQTKSTLKPVQIPQENMVMNPKDEQDIEGVESDDDSIISYEED